MKIHRKGAKSAKENHMSKVGAIDEDMKILFRFFQNFF
jgi:hypothetical protein